jgi:Phage tail lysozyme
LATIIDSLFLELGIDTTKFSKDQTRALGKIQQFESQAKRSAGNASGAIKTVGDAFKDLYKDSQVGASAKGIDSLATKFKNLGISMQVAGGVGAPMGMMARALGMMLSPAALGVAAIGLLAKETWDFNKSMTASNATLARNAELSGMSATNLWAMGQATKTVGGNAEAVEASIAGLQTSLAGMSIGVGSAVPQLIGMARLRKYGAKFNPGGFGQGVDEESLFKAAQQMYQKEGRAKTMAFMTQYGLMNEDQANLAMSATGWQDYQNAKAKAEAMKTGGGFEAVVRNSLKSQQGLGENDIAGAINAEEGYGGIQQPMQTIVGLLTDIRTFVGAILNGLSSVFNWISHPGQALDGAKDFASGVKYATVESAKAVMDLAGSAATSIFQGPAKERMATAMQALMNKGLSQDDAAAIVGNMAQESSMNPLARNGNHIGLGQWDASRQADFAKRYGYQMGSDAVPQGKQFNDQTLFALDELQSSQRAAATAMGKARGLLEKTSAFMMLDERPGDSSLSQRFSYAEQASAMLAAVNSRASPPQNTVTSETNIGDVHVHTNATDPASHAAAFRDGISKQPLVDPSALVALSLSTRGMAL